MAIERGLNPSEYEFTSPFGVSMTSTNGSCSIHSYVYIYIIIIIVYIYVYMYLYYIYMQPPWLFDTAMENGPCIEDF